MRLARGKWLSLVFLYVKMFLSVFLAILAAAAVFYFLLDHKNKLEQWAKATQVCNIRLELSERTRGELIHSKTESRTEYFLEMEQRHALEEDAEKVTATLISLLEHKPSLFGFSPAKLTKDESAQLENQKSLRDWMENSTAPIRAAEKAWAEAAANVSRDKARLRLLKEAFDKLGK